MKISRDKACSAATSAALAAALLLVLPGSAAAQNRQPVPPPPCPFFIFCAAPPLSPVETWRLYRESGTLGRQGLGASPFHPEGPGNRSF